MPSTPTVVPVPSPLGVWSDWISSSLVTIESVCLQGGLAADVVRLVASDADDSPPDDTYFSWVLSGGVGLVQQPDIPPAPFYAVKQTEGDPTGNISVQMIGQTQGGGAMPAGAATAANQVLEIEQLATIGAALTSGVLVAHGPATDPVASTGLESSHVLKATGGVHYSTTVVLDASAPDGTYYIQMFQGSGAAIPADGTAVNFHAPQQVVFKSGSPFYVVFNDTATPARFASGLCVVISSTQFTKTIAGNYITVDSSVE